MRLILQSTYEIDYGAFISFYASLVVAYRTLFALSTTASAFDVASVVEFV